MLKVGLVGCGFMGTMHANVYSALDGIQLDTAWDKVPETLSNYCSKWGANLAESFESILANPAIDIIDVCLPTYLHSEFTIKALKAGKHVLCEKPMALCTADADKMINAAIESGKTLMIAHCIRFWPEYALVKGINENGRLGKLLSINLTRYGAFPAWASEGWNEHEELAGGGALDMHIHDTDYALFLMGEPDSMVSHGTNDSKGVGQICTTMKFGDSWAHLEGGWNLPSSAPFKMAIRAIFEKGAIIMDGGPLTVYEDGKNPEVPQFTQMSASEAGGNLSDLGGYYFEIEHFRDAILAGVKPTIATPESSRRTLAVALDEISQVKAKLGK